MLEKLPDSGVWASFHLDSVRTKERYPLMNNQGKANTRLVPRYP